MKHFLSSVQSRWSKREALTIAVALVVWSGLIGLFQSGVFQSIKRADIMVDIVDTRLITEGLERAPHFLDTLQWWYGPWVMGQEYAFYRPLTSLTWWCEFQLFGRHGLGAFTTIHILLHLVVLVMALLFLRRLCGLKKALLAVMCYALFLEEKIFGMPSALHAVVGWKDDPEMWVAIALLFSLSKFFDYLRDAKRRNYALSFAAFVVGIAFKESAYVLPPLLLLLLWHQRKWREYLRAVTPFFVFAAVAFAFRFWALGGMGFRFGSNGSWLERWILNVGGGWPMRFLVTGNVMAYVISLFALLLLLTYVRAQMHWRFAVLAGLVFFLWRSFLWSRDVIDPMYLPLNASLWIDAAWIFFYWFLWWRVLARRSRLQLFGWLWVLIAYIPLMTAPITAHALYLPALGWSLWLALALLDCWEVGARFIQAKLPHPYLQGYERKAT